MAKIEELKSPRYAVCVSSNAIFVFDTIDKYAEANYKSYIGYELVNVEDLTMEYDWIANYLFNDKTEAKVCDEYVDNFRAT